MVRWWLEGWGTEHLDLAIRAFGCLNCLPNPQIVIDHKANKPNYEVIRSDYLEDYPDAVKSGTSPSLNHSGRS